MHAQTLRISKVTVEKRNLWFILHCSSLVLFTATCTMELAEVSELSSTERYECVRCVLYILVLLYVQFLLIYVQSEGQSKDAALF